MTTGLDRAGRRTAVHWSFLARPGWIGAAVAAVAFAAACWLILAPWQFGRNTERSAQNADIAAALAAAPVPLDQLLHAGSPPDPASSWHQVTATGSFDQAAQAYVRLRQDQQGNPADEVVVPFRLTDGTIVVVDRGYATQAAVTADAGLPPLPDGIVTITGRVQPEQPDPSHRPAARRDGRLEVYGIDSRSLAGGAATDGTLRGGFIQLVQGSPGVLRQIGVPQTDAGPFLSYALQWCVFGAMALLALGYFAYREAVDPREPDDRTHRDRSGFDRSQLYDER